MERRATAEDNDAAMWHGGDMQELPVEIEAKFYPVDAEAIRATLKANGAALTHPERTMRRVLYRKTENPGIGGDYLRVRDEGDVVRISLKIHAREGGNISDQREIDVVTDDYERSLALMDALGFVRTNEQENRRETWRLGGGEITIDFWPGLAPYVEIEAATEPELELMAGLLGLRWDERRVGSVAYLYAEAYGMDHDKAMELLEHCTFEENPFER